MSSKAASSKQTKSTSPLFSEAPSCALAFPQDLGITAGEIIAFLPNALRSRDITFRFASNETSNQTVVSMANYFRTQDSKGPVSANSMCKIMQKSMRAAGYTYLTTGNQGPLASWTIGLHQQHNTKNHHGPWNHSELSLAGMAPDAKKVVNNVRFDSLAKGVRRWPDVQRGDGLNLTGCVQYAKAHPEEDLMFPRDFKTLAQKLGIKPTLNCHLDIATFRRWSRGQMPVPLGPLIADPPQVPAPTTGLAAGQPSSQPGPRRTQARVSKAYKSSKVQGQDSRASAARRKQLNNLSKGQQRQLESMKNILPPLPATGSRLGGTQSSGSSMLAAADAQPQRHESTFSPAPLMFSLSAQQTGRPAPSQTFNFIEELNPEQHQQSHFSDVPEWPQIEHPADLDLSNAYQDENSCEILEMIADLDAGRPVCWDVDDVSDFEFAKTWSSYGATQSYFDRALYGEKCNPYHSATAAQDFVAPSPSQYGQVIGDHPFTGDFEAPGGSGGDGSLAMFAAPEYMSMLSSVTMPGRLLH